MNRLMSAAKKMKRIVLTQRHLFGTVAMFMFVMTIFLVLWSSLDTPQRRGEFTLTDDVTDDGETIVEVGYYCSSDSDIWRYIAVLWHCILLMCATVLAFQTRNLQQGFSESSVLAIIIYSHFVFVMLRVITFLLGGTLLESQVAGFRSIIYSTDAIVTMCVYFVPKLLTDDDTFYSLTHGAAGSRGEGRTSVITMVPGRSVIMVDPNRPGGGLSNPSVGLSNPSGNLSSPFDPDSDSDDEGADKPKSLAKGSGHSLSAYSGHSRNSAAKKSKDVLGNRVSWGGMGFTTVMRSSHADSDDDRVDDEEQKEEEHKEETPFVKPVDVLKGANSWGAAHVTMLIHSEEDKSSTHEDNRRGEGGDLGAINEEESEELVGTRSVLTAPSLPKEAPVRFDYASSRINRVRHRHHPENYDDEDEHS